MIYIPNFISVILSGLERMCNNNLFDIKKLDFTQILLLVPYYKEIITFVNPFRI